MKDPEKKAFGGLLRLLIVLATLLFLPAWTLHYTEAWIFLGVFFVPVLAITVYLMKNDPMLLERRMKAGPGAEKDRSQKIIQSLAGIAFIAAVVLPALDHRFAWSGLPAWGVAGGNILVSLGLFLTFFVFKENTFASGVIEVAAGQKVVSTGPYRLVRHPMYLGALIMLSGVPLALGSWWGLSAILPMTAVIVVRILKEEKFLIGHLSGYSDYQMKVRYRLVPFIW